MSAVTRFIESSINLLTDESGNVIGEYALVGGVLGISMVSAMSLLSHAAGSTLTNTQGTLYNAQVNP